MQNSVFPSKRCMYNIVPVFIRNCFPFEDMLLFHLLGDTSERRDEVRYMYCAREERNGSPRNTHGVALAKNMWQSAVDTLVMALGRRDEIGDAIRCISADEGCNLTQTPFIKVASLPWQIQGYCCQHGQPPCNLEQPGLHLRLSLLIRFYASLFYFIFYLVNLPVAFNTRSTCIIKIEGDI